MKNIFLSYLFLSSSILVFAVNEKPFVIPEIKEWKGGKDNFNFEETSKIIVLQENDSVRQIGEALSQDLNKMFGLEIPVTISKPQDGDIILKIKKDRKLGEEGYEIDIKNKITIEAPTVTGLYWGTRTILQMADNRFENKEFTIPQGYVRDWPDYPLRGFLIDVGRKFIPLERLHDYADIMSYYKMNFLQVHLNDNGFVKFFNNDWDKTYSAFRLESETFPGLSAEDGYYTKSDFKDFQKKAASQFVEVMPEIDVPAHSLAFSRYKPEIGSKEYGMDHLDLMKEETYQFLDSLFAEYLEGEDPVFVGPRVSIGTDEYSNKDSIVVEKFRYLTDRYIKYVESYGKKAGVWGALTHAKGETPVKSENVLMNAWYNGYADPKTMIEEGYELVSIPDAYVYIVPAAGYYQDYLDTKFLYDNWTPAHINGEVFEEHHPAIKGGMFAVWNDHVGNGISMDDIHHRVFPALQTIASKTWGADNLTVPFEIFDINRLNLSEAPGINLLGRRVSPGTKEYNQFWAVDEVEPNIEYPYENVGYDYIIEFELEGEKESPGTELFRSGDNVFYLSDPISGMIGFARDGYLNTFPYSVDKGDKMKIAIEGDNNSTRLFIDGKLAYELSTSKKWCSNEAYINYVPTLVFPLRKSGNFKSRISKFSASQKY